MSSFSQINSLNGTASTFFFLGNTPYDNCMVQGPTGYIYISWSIIVNNFTAFPVGNSATTGPFTSEWTISGTGGTGKIESVIFSNGPGGGRHVNITLQSGGGVFPSLTTFNPPYVRCFVKGARILTNSGYKAIEDLQTSDIVKTSDGRSIPFKMYSQTIEKTTKTTAPYKIETGALGRGFPTAPLFLSPNHKIQIRRGLWSSPNYLATIGKAHQYGVGETITYYHIECAEYLRDNLI